MRRRHLTFAQRREYRRMMRLLRELDGEDAGRGGRRTSARKVATRLLAGSLSLVLVAVFALFLAHKVWGVTLTLDGFRVARALGAPPEVATGIGTYEFLQLQPQDPKRPVAYDPCRSIEYQVNDALAPPGSRPLVENAVAEINHATGLRFEYVGTTERPPYVEPTSFRALREPVLIAWTTPGMVPELEGRTAGLGGSVPRRHELSGDLEYVTGTVALDAPDLEDVLTRPEGAAQVRAIVVHELGHLVGLDHVRDTNELMHDDNAGRLDLGPGDLEGLALLGSGPCYH